MSSVPTPEERVQKLEEDVALLKIELAVLKTEFMTEVKSINKSFQTLLEGTSPGCMKHEARIAAIELSVKGKADNTDLSNVKRSLYAMYGILGTIAVGVLVGIVVNIVKG